MEMHQVRYFLAVSRVLNFTRAADECHVAQPSLTRAIKKLEEELGGDLFRRERSRTHLTELGRLMQPHLQQCYDSAVAAKALARSLSKGKIAPLRLALSHTIGMRQLTPALNELMRVCPGLSLEFFRGSVEEIAEHMKTGHSEIAVAGPLADDWERFEKWPLFEEDFTLVAHKDRALARRNEVELKDLAGETIFSRPYCEQGERLAAILEEADIDNWDAHRVVSEHDLLELLQANMGVAILPESFVAANDLRAIRLRGVEMRRTVHAYSVSGRQRSPAGSLLLKLLRGADWSAAGPGSMSRTAA